MMKQVTERPAPMNRFRTDIPRDLDAIVMRLLEKDPDNRFRDGTALVEALAGAPLQPLRASPANPSVSSNPWMDTLSSVQVPELPRLPAFEPIPGWNARVAARNARWTARQLRHEQAAVLKDAKENSKPLPDRVRSFRRRFASYVATSTFLFGINAATSGGSHHFWWAIFPAMGMMMGLMNEGGSLWAAGARLRDVFGSRRTLPELPNSGSPPPPPPSQDTKDAELIAEVLAGPRGTIARQALADHRTIKDLVGRMSKSDRALLPDVEATAGGLYQRIAELGRALHRLDNEIGPERLPELDARIAQSEAQEGGAERERRVRLLKRQREMLATLLDSRERLSEQYESAGLLLQNLKLDMIRMRSSGLQSGLADVTSVTQEARALSKEIGYVLAAADELRDIRS
jgi:serine/threonine-protein kinase